MVFGSFSGVIKIPAGATSGASAEVDLAFGTNFRTGCRQRAFSSGGPVSGLPTEKLGATDVAPSCLKGERQFEVSLDVDSLGRVS